MRWARPQNVVGFRDFELCKSAARELQNIPGVFAAKCRHVATPMLTPAFWSLVGLHCAASGPGRSAADRLQAVPALGRSSAKLDAVICLGLSGTASASENDSLHLPHTENIPVPLPHCIQILFVQISIHSETILLTY